MLLAGFDYLAVGVGGLRALRVSRVLSIEASTVDAALTSCNMACGAFWAFWMA